MRIAIVGGHGKVAQLMTPLLVGSGHEVTSFIRQASQIHDVGGLGADPVELDVAKASKDDIAKALDGIDAVIWAAGAGGGDPARTKAVDRDAAIRTMDAAEQAGVQRFVMVSFSGARRSQLPADDNPFYTYALAKVEADEHLRASSLDWTILGPGPLTNDNSSGFVNSEASAGHGDTTPRELVAQIAAQVINDRRASKKTLVFGAGHATIDEWLDSVALARA